MRRLVLVLSLAIASWPARAAAQQVPRRDTTTVTRTVGTASVAGIVVDDQASPVPVRRAVVTVAGPTLGPSRSAITDDDGRFAVERLPAGRGTLTVSRASFVTSTYGAKRPGRPGTAIDVRAGEPVTGLTVRIWRGAVIAGVVRDEQGVPAPGLPVRVIAAHQAGDGTIFTLTSSGMKTNEAGEYRIFGLEPGAYLVSVTPPVLRGAALTTMREAEMDAALAALRARMAGGPAATSMPAPPSARSADPAPASAAFIYAPIFFPGTANMSEATPVTVGPGQEVDNVDLALEQVTTARISGLAARPDGQPVSRASVLVVQTPPAGGYALNPPLVFTAISATDGTFRVAGVPPGDYRLSVGAAPSGGAPGHGGDQGPDLPGAAIWGETTLTVSGADVDIATITLEPAPALTGRVDFAGATSAPPAHLTQWRAALVAAASLTRRPGPGSTVGINAPQPVMLAEDGSFAIPGIPPGSYLFQLTGPGIGAAGWWTRSMTVGGRDLLDRFIDVQPRTPAMNAIVAMSDRHTELSGTLQAGAGRPASDVFVLAFSANRDQWGAGARRVRAVRPGVDGHFSITDLPPGDYLLAAVTDLDAEEVQSPSLLEQLVPASIRLTIGEGEKKVQDLRLGGG